MDAIIGSMTPKERAKPELLNAKRKIRVAKGSGTTVQEVNKLLKMHQEMATVMKKMKKMGGLKGLGALLRQGRHGRCARRPDGRRRRSAAARRGWWRPAGASRRPGGFPPGFQNFLKKK